MLAGAMQIARSSDAEARTDGRVELQYTFDLERDRYLGDHRIDGRPVLPFAVAMELMAEVAVGATPGRAVAGLREIRLLGGVALEHERAATVRIDAVRAGGDEVEVTINPADGSALTIALWWSCALQAREDLTRRAPAPLQHAAVLPRSSRASVARIPFRREGRIDPQACAVV